MNLKLFKLICVHHCSNFWISPSRYHDAVEELSAGPVLALEVRQKDAVETFRKLVGPMDPEIASNLRPDTLRSKFGVNIVQNAVHCTDLAEDGLLEVEYFFNILYNRWATLKSSKSWSWRFEVRKVGVSVGRGRGSKLGSCWGNCSGVCGNTD